MRHNNKSKFNKVLDSRALLVAYFAAHNSINYRTLALQWSRVQRNATGAPFPSAKLLILPLLALLATGRGHLSFDNSENCQLTDCTVVQVLLELQEVLQDE